jgi:hypothetical protein
MGFWFAFFLFVGSTVLSALLQKRPKDVQPSSLGDFQAPTAQEGRPIPVVFGTVKLAAPNVVWFGDLKVVPIKKKSGGFLGIGAKKVTVGYKYYAGLQMALCHGTVDELLDIVVGEKSLGGTTSVRVNLPFGQSQSKPTCTPALAEPRPAGSKVTFDIYWPNMFGGQDREGGLEGKCSFYFGGQDQTANSYMTARLGTTAPAYRGLCYAVAEQMYLGTSNYIKDWAFVVRRCPSNLGLAANITNVSGDANPVEIIYDLMTSPIYGLGIPSARFNLSSFQAAATTLANEGMGMSMQADSDAAADQVIGDVLRHIDGVLYTDPATGLWTLTLARADYNPATLLELTESDILEAPEFSRGSWEETLNEVKVKYVDRSTFKERIAQAQETANFAIRGELSSDTIPFLGFSNATIAQKVAIRELKTHSYPLMKGRLKANRKAWNLRIGGVFKFTWTPYGISGMAMRVTAINYGTLDKGEIEIDCVEDIFAVSSTAYTPPSGSSWTDPLNQPQPPAAQLLQEVPYHLLKAEEIRVLVAAVRGDGTSTGFDVFSDEGQNTYYQTNTIELFCPSGTLQSAYARNAGAASGFDSAALDTVGFIVGSSSELERLASTDANGRARGDNLALIDSEWISWQNVTDNGDGTYTISGVVRGIFDTVPADHAQGARVWFISDGSGLSREEPFPADQLVKVKCLPFNSRGQVAIEDVTQVQITTASRVKKPYPPGNVRVNNLYWPAATKEDVMLSWAHRHRTAQTSVVQQDAGNQAAAPEGNYTVEVYLGGVLKQTYAALTGTSQVYSALQRFTDDKDGSKTTRFRIKPINGSLAGTIRDTDAFLMGGMGMCLGLELGGRNA